MNKSSFSFAKNPTEPKPFMVLYFMNQTLSGSNGGVSCHNMNKFENNILEWNILQ